MEIKGIDGTFSICKVADYSQINWHAEYVFIEKIDEENSLVCLTEDVPSNVIEKEDKWKAFRIQGQLDFSLIGILSQITGILADNNIGVFAISTYNTDYILVKEEKYQIALQILSQSGYTII